MFEEPVTDTGQAEQPGALCVVTTAIDGVLVVSAAGDIDHNTCHRLQRALDDPETAACRAVVDLHEVTFMDSSGINTLIAAHHSLHQAHGWLRLAGTPASVMRTFQLVGLDTVIDCHPSLDDALNA
ncbi:STAS domain-containing protein [Streptomyces carpinensis]|uniref:Anti-sigma factor antagonist n=1 Tax=Streptomyces carpinensis TaxID=66369 RepID=A0ABV1WK12_9ACTN|nr:STAS domain-containing protein [Streptomyces carpinensis]